MVGAATNEFSCRCVATAMMAVMLGACGGGGAAIDAGAATGPGQGTSPPPASTPSAPSSSVVTTSGETFTPGTITITQGASVTWQITGTTHNVTFGATKPTGGDVANTAPGGSATRSFPTAGTYPYACTRHSGMTGQVVVTGSGGSATPPASPPSAPSGSVVQATLVAFKPERLEIATGSVVTWEFAGGTFGIVFKDSAPPGGNIPDTSPGATVSRTFPTAGDYDYHSSKNDDVKGRIRVR